MELDCLLTIVIFVTIIGVLSIVLLHKFYQATKTLEAPNLDVTEYWGRGNRDAQVLDISVNPFCIEYDHTAIDTLQRRLGEPLTLHPPLEGVKHEYGTNSKDFMDFVEYWRSDYMPRWAERLKLLNSVPHFKTNIQGLSIHFVHLRPNVKDKTVVPLLLLHGWPGSIREFYDIFPLLTTANADSDYVFEVIAPSLPGFGWSDASQKPGFGPAEISVVLRNLMLRLGHTRFLLQGGDWGSILGSNVATLFPENVCGYHTNFASIRTTLSTVKLMVASCWPSLFVDRQNVSFVFPLMEKVKMLLNETGCVHLQATKPDTIGIALSNNPVGLAAYLYEKFAKALPNHAHDPVLDNVMIYYLTNSITTSFRLYAEAFTDKQRGYKMWRVPVRVPVGVARFANDFGHCIDWQLRDKYPKMVHSTWHTKGGHFVALESPLVLYVDFVQFVSKLKMDTLSIANA